MSDDKKLQEPVVDIVDIENPEPNETHQVPNSQKKDDSTNSKASLLNKSLGFKTFIFLKRNFKTILVRLMFITIPSYNIFFLACIYQQNFFFFLYIFYLIVIVDGFWVIIRRSGYDYYWFSISFASYTVAMVLVIIYEMDFKYDKEDLKCQTNATDLKYFKQCGNTDIKICTLVEIIVIGFLGTLLVGRWTMPPSKRMDRDAIYFQVAGYTALSADVLEIAQYMQNEQVAESYMLLKGCQTIFGISLSQFSFSLGAVKQRNASLNGWRRFFDIFFSTEAWTLALAFFTQELPCFILRMILIFSVLSERDYSLYFFVLKNGLMMILLVFRASTLVWRQYKNERKIMPDS